MKSPGRMTRLGRLVLAIAAAGSIAARAQNAWMPASDWDGSLAGHIAVLALAVDPVAPDHVYAASGNQILKSMDGGRIFAALPPVPTTQAIRSLAVLRVSAAQTPRLLVGVENAGALVSLDGGLTYVRGMIDGAPITGTIWSIVPASETGDIAYATGTGTTYRTDDGGLTWRALAVPDVVGDATTNLAVGKRGDVVFAGRGSGLFKSADGGAHWNALGGGLPAPPYNAAGASRHRSRRRATDSGDHSGPRNLSLGRCGRFLAPLGGAPFECCIYTLYASGNTLWTSINGGVIVARSIDGGATWGGLPLPYGPWEQFVRDPATGRLYASSRDDESTAGLVRSSDGGDSWSIDASGLGSAPARSLIVDPGRALYAMTPANALHAMTVATGAVA